MQDPDSSHGSAKDFALERTGLLRALTAGCCRDHGLPVQAIRNSMLSSQVFFSSAVDAPVCWRVLDSGHVPDSGRLHRDEVRLRRGDRFNICRFASADQCHADLPVLTLGVLIWHGILHDIPEKRTAQSANPLPPKRTAMMKWASGRQTEEAVVDLGNWI